MPRSKVIDQPKTQRFNMFLSRSELEAINDWRHANQCASLSEAVRHLCRSALAPGPADSATVTTPPPQPPKPALPRQGELFPLPEIDMMERLVAIVERTNRIFGVSAARRLWPMLGLPDLRTSNGQEDEDEGSRPRRERSKPPEPRGASDGVRGEKEGGSAPPALPGKLPLFRPWVARFIQECCEPAPKATLRAGAFREAYVRWAALHGAPLATPPLLGRYAVELGLRRHKSLGVTVYLDVRLKALELAKGSAS